MFSPMDFPESGETSGLVENRSIVICTPCYEFRSFLKWGQGIDNKRSSKVIYMV
jgi:hypothetical protein